MSALASVDTPWYFLMSGLLEELEGSEASLEEIFDQAVAAAVSPGRQRFFGVFLCASSFVGHLGSEALANTLQRKYRRIGRGRSLSVYFGVCSGTAQAWAK